MPPNQWRPAQTRSLARASEFVHDREARVVFSQLHVTMRGKKTRFAGVGKIADEMFTPQVNVLILRPDTPVSIETVLQASPHHPTGPVFAILSAFGGEVLRTSFCLFY